MIRQARIWSRVPQRFFDPAIEMVLFSLLVPRWIYQAEVRTMIFLSKSSRMYFIKYLFMVTIPSHIPKKVKTFSELGPENWRLTWKPRPVKNDDGLTAQPRYRQQWTSLPADKQTGLSPAAEKAISRIQGRRCRHRQHRPHKATADDRIRAHSG